MKYKSDGYKILNLQSIGNSVEHWLLTEAIGDSKYRFVGFSINSPIFWSVPGYHVFSVPLEAVVCQESISFLCNIIY